MICYSATFLPDAGFCPRFDMVFCGIKGDKSSFGEQM
jgi:hypothetical protein